MAWSVQKELPCLSFSLNLVSLPGRSLTCCSTGPRTTLHYTFWGCSAPLLDMSAGGGEEKRGSAGRRLSSSCRFFVADAEVLRRLAAGHTHTCHCSTARTGRLRRMSFCHGMRPCHVATGLSSQPGVLQYSWQLRLPWKCVSHEWMNWQQIIIAAGFPQREP